jgi:hypothetical protein
VKKDDEATGALPGLPIRYAEEEQGRFVLIENPAVK